MRRLAAASGAAAPPRRPHRRPARRWPSSRHPPWLRSCRRRAVGAPRISGRECGRWIAAGSARAHAQHQCIEHGAESKESKQFVNQEPYDRHDVQHQCDRAADEHRDGRMAGGPKSRPEMRPPSHASMTALPNSDMQNKAPTTKGTAAMPITVTHNKTSSTGRQKNAQQCRQRRVSGLRLQGLHALVYPLAKHQCQAGIKRQQAERQRPSPAESCGEGQGPAQQQTMRYPGVQSAESRAAANIPIDDSLHRAVNDGGRIALHRTHDRDHVAADFGVRSQLDVAQYRHHIAIHLGVDIGIAHDRDRIVAHRSRDPGIADNRNDIHRFAVTGRRPKYRHHRIGLLAALQMAGMTDADDIAVIVMLPIARRCSSIRLRQSERSLRSESSSNASSVEAAGAVADADDRPWAGAAALGAGAVAVALWRRRRALRRRGAWRRPLSTAA